MAHAAPTLGRWGDGHLYSSTPAATNADATPFWNDETGEGFRKVEALFDRGTMHRVSVRVHYTNASRSSPIFTNLTLYVENTKGQNLHTHEAVVDRSDMNAISLRIRHTGSEFIIYNVRLLAQREKQRPRG